MKEFDQWNIIKKNVEAQKKPPFFKEKEIYYVKMGRNIGHEENGKGKNFLRPILVLKKFDRHIFWGVPLSTTQKRGSWYFEFSFTDEVTSVALIPQLRLFDSKRLFFRLGKISNEDFSHLKQKIRSFLHAPD